MARDVCLSTENKTTSQPESIRILHVKINLNAYLTQEQNILKFLSITYK